MIRPVSRSRINASRSGVTQPGRRFRVPLRSPLRPHLVTGRPHHRHRAGSQVCLVVGMSPHAQQYADVLGSAGAGPLLGWLLVCPFMVKTVRPRPSSNLLPVSPALPPARKVGGCLGA